MNYKNPTINRGSEKTNVKATNGVVVFIEKYTRYKNENGKEVHYLLMDFPIDESHKEEFLRRTERQLPEGKSMLEISNAQFKKDGAPLEGHFYNLPTELIEGFGWNDVTDPAEDGFNFIAFKADGGSTEIRFGPALVYKVFAQDVTPVSDTIWKKHVVPVLDSLAQKNIIVSVYDVGQGNWNEIEFNNKALIVYDFGSSSSQNLLNKITTTVIPQNRNIRIDSILDPNFKFLKILIISHWDVDHYNGILPLHDAMITAFDFCIVSNKIENETTYNAIEKLLRLTTVYPIEMNPRGRGHGATSVLTTIYNSNLLKLYKGTKCSDRNKRGLLVSLHTKKVDYVFSGDHHYNQITDYIIPNCKTGKLNIVVPHHGGEAGDYTLVNSWSNGKDSIISSGNRYSHPLQPVVDVFTAMFTLVHRTDTHGDYNRTL